MNIGKTKGELIEETGKMYDKIIFEDDYIPKAIYVEQIAYRNAEMAKVLEGKCCEYILDLGCGTGFHSGNLAKYAKNIIGADMSYGALKKCKNKHNIDVVMCDVQFLPFKDRTFDIIWIAGLLHHIPRDIPHAIHDNISRTIKKDALLLIDEPNSKNILNFISIGISKGDPTGDERPLPVILIKNLLREHNQYIIVQCDFYGFFSPLAALIPVNPLKKILIWMDNRLSTTPMKQIFLRWFIIAKKQ
jgi:ubiquinone/menaquinone biosynthesis C-methylase UbiE